MYDIVKMSIQNMYQFKGDKATMAPSDVNLTVNEITMHFANIQSRTWTQMVAHISHIKLEAERSSSGSRDVTSVKNVMDELKRFCMHGKRKSN